MKLKRLLSNPECVVVKISREVIVRPIMKGTFTLHCILARLNDIGHPAETQDHVIIVE
eukprot:gnl/Chilomastix_caulleri/6001.p1 GENE.gnl/Chilomastix_caulleri/6001~~gnl/Chilomastix_caulleri/6001.p1  ORF type:complete len:58 (+),score=5.68 gnl/Chilomastix_caulleri/6001:121-294(+)